MPTKIFTINYENCVDILCLLHCKTNKFLLNNFIFKYKFAVLPKRPINIMNANEKSTVDDIKKYIFNSLIN